MSLLSDSVQIGILASILFVVICWLIRDSFKVEDLNGKHVFLTGCDSGFGNLLAKQLDRRGFHVITACLTEKGSQELQACTTLSLTTVILNLTYSSSIDSAVKFVKEETDGEGLFGLVNNAERATPTAPTDWMQINDFHTILDVNLMGLIEITLKLLPLLKKAKGRVVNIASVMGRLAFLGGGYCSSKWGVEAFSDTLRYFQVFSGLPAEVNYNRAAGTGNIYFCSTALNRNVQSFS